MAYLLDDPETEDIIRLLAKAKNRPAADVIRLACLRELERERARAETPLWERLQPLVERVSAAPETGSTADKAFFDEMWGEPE